jgi:hypothetical protein
LHDLIVKLYVVGNVNQFSSSLANDTRENTRERTHKPRFGKLVTTRSDNNDDDLPVIASNGHAEAEGRRTVDEFALSLPSLGRQQKIDLFTALSPGEWNAQRGGNYLANTQGRNNGCGVSSHHKHSRIDNLVDRNT